MYAQSTPTVRLSNLGRKLVEAGLMSEEQAVEAMAKASEKGRTFTSHLVREKLVDATGFGHVDAADAGNKADVHEIALHPSWKPT